MTIPTAFIGTIHTPAAGLRSLVIGLAHAQIPERRALDMLSFSGGIKARDLSAWMCGEEVLTSDHADPLAEMATAAGADPRILSYRAVARMIGEEDARAMDEEEAPADEGEKPSYMFCLSDGESDRARDIVDQSWILDDFTRNPVAPWAHDYARPAVGKWRSVAVRNGRLTGRLVPFPLESYLLSQTVAAQLAAGVLTTVSVGFMPGTVLMRSDLPEGDPRYGQRGLVFLNNSLMECSPTPVPMNPRAGRRGADRPAPKPAPVDPIVALFGRT